ncbi:antirestriction protein ArdA [Nonomuraea sp. ZG12]|uniref:antirestriction protein ArdA n=1 Tax=Nonomuraea sp. ZG12 TaxID=3452207 RepID=UPI003F8A74B7
MQSTVSVHFWNLAAYVGGNLVGGWVDLDECANLDDFKAKVAEVTRNADEVLLGDYDSEFSIEFREYQSLESVWEIHEKLSEVDSDNRQAFADYLAYVGGVNYLDEAVSNFEDRYRGEYDSMEDFAWKYTEGFSDEGIPNIPGFRIEVDVIAWEQDFWISDHGHVFDSH